MITASKLSKDTKANYYTFLVSTLMTWLFSQASSSAAIIEIANSSTAQLCGDDLRDARGRLGYQTVR